jgi:hypothetical protein
MFYGSEKRFRKVVEGSVTTYEFGSKNSMESGAFVFRTVFSQ